MTWEPIITKGFFMDTGIALGFKGGLSLFLEVAHPKSNQLESGQWSTYVLGDFDQELQLIDPLVGNTFEGWEAVEISTIKSAQEGFVFLLTWQLHTKEESWDIQSRFWPYVDEEKGLPFPLIENVFNPHTKITIHHGPIQKDLLMQIPQDMICPPFFPTPGAKGKPSIE